jgi:acyl carrier protein
MKEEVQTKVIEVIARVFEVETQNIEVNFKKEDFDTWDSIGHLQLVMNLESDFNIKFRIEEINNIQGVQDCINLVATYSK